MYFYYTQIYLNKEININIPKTVRRCVIAPTATIADDHITRYVNPRHPKLVYRVLSLPICLYLLAKLQEA